MVVDDVLIARGEVRGEVLLIKGLNGVKSTYVESGWINMENSGVFSHNLYDLRNVFDFDVERVPKEPGVYWCEVEVKPDHFGALTFKVLEARKGWVEH